MILYHNYTVISKSYSFKIYFISQFSFNTCTKSCFCKI